MDSWFNKEYGKRDQPHHGVILSDMEKAQLKTFEEAHRHPMTLEEHDATFGGCTFGNFIVLEYYTDSIGWWWVVRCSRKGCGAKQTLETELEV